MHHKRHFAALDGLRGIAAISVAVAHLSQAMPIVYGPPQAQLAVDFFFMLSGFVIGYAYEHKLKSGFGFGRFTIVRLIRLYPMILIGVTLGALSRLMDGAAGHGVVGVLGAAAFGLLLLPLPRRSPIPVSAFPLNGALWSLTYELVSNLVYAATIRWLTTRVLVVAGILFSAALYAVLMKENGVHPSIAWGWSLLYGLARVFSPFTIGLLLFRLSGTPRRYGDVRAVLAAFALAAVLWAPIGDNAPYDCVAITILFPSILLIARGLVANAGVAVVATALGELSYPLYTVNQPFFTICAMVAKRAGLHGNALAGFAAVAFVGCLTGSVMVLKWFDKPVRALLTRTWVETGRAR